MSNLRHLICFKCSNFQAKAIFQAAVVALLIGGHLQPEETAAVHNTHVRLRQQQTLPARGLGFPGENLTQWSLFLFNCPCCF